MADGDPFIVVNEADSAIQDYDISYEVDEASPSVKEYYEKTPYTVTENEFGALDYVLEDNTEDGYNDEVMIFYENSDGEILGYDETQYGGSEEFTYTFEAPGYEYDKYEVIRTKID